ncbi:1677_t:CDS:1, partial [Dentiscutata heterogama]
IGILETNISNRELQLNRVNLKEYQTHVTKKQIEKQKRSGNTTNHI